MITLSCFAQQDTLSTQKFDDFVSVKMQGEITKTDSILGMYDMKSRTAVFEGSYYVFQKLIILNSEEEGIMPGDEESLYKYYGYMSKGFINTLEANSGYKLIDTTRVDIQGYKALKIRAGFKKKKAVEAIFLVLGTANYIISYTNQDEFNEKEKEIFFKSISISENNPGQFTGVSSAYRLGEMLGELSAVLVIIIIVVVLVIRSKKKK